MTFLWFSVGCLVILAVVAALFNGFGVLNLDKKLVHTWFGVKKG